MSMYSHKSHSIQPRTNPDKFAVRLGLASPDLISFLPLARAALTTQLLADRSVAAFCYSFHCLSLERFESVQILQILTMLQNENSVAKIRFDTAENEPS